VSDSDKLSLIAHLLETEAWEWDLCAKIADVLDDVNEAKP
jgi:hypothetical protein